MVQIAVTERVKHEAFSSGYVPDVNRSIISFHKNNM